MSNKQEVLDNIQPLVKLMDEHFGHMDGAFKVALLKTVAAYYENLTTAQATQLIYTNAFKNL